MARSDARRKASFELVGATAEHYQALGFVFMVVEATNQWTGAACDVLGGVRVHYTPFQTLPTVRQSVEPLESVGGPPNGWLSNKDSGSMFYVSDLI